LFDGELLSTKPYRRAFRGLFNEKARRQQNSAAEEIQRLCNVEAPTPATKKFPVKTSRACYLPVFGDSKPEVDKLMNALQLAKSNRFFTTLPVHERLKQPEIVIRSAVSTLQWIHRNTCSKVLKSSPESSHLLDLFSNQMAALNEAPDLPSTVVTTVKKLWSMRHFQDQINGLMQGSDAPFHGSWIV
jgi:hypothetical protein